MSVPNIAALTYIYGSTAYISPGTSATTSWTYSTGTSGTTTLTGLTPATNYVNKIETIIASNYTSSAVTVTLAISDNATYASGTAHYIAYQISVPPNASLVINDKTTPIYVTENQSLGVIAGTASALSVVACLETIG